MPSSTELLFIGEFFWLLIEFSYTSLNFSIYSWFSVRRFYISLIYFSFVLNLLVYSLLLKKSLRSHKMSVVVFVTFSFISVYFIYNVSFCLSMAKVYPFYLSLTGKRLWFYYSLIMLFSLHFTYFLGSLLLPSFC